MTYKESFTLLESERPDQFETENGADFVEPAMEEC